MKGKIKYVSDTLWKLKKTNQTNEEQTNNNNNYLPSLLFKIAINDISTKSTNTVTKS